MKQGDKGLQGLDTQSHTLSFGYIHFDLTTAFSLDMMFRKPPSGFASSFDSVHATHKTRAWF